MLVFKEMPLENVNIPGCAGDAVDQVEVGQVHVRLVLVQGLL